MQRRCTKHVAWYSAISTLIFGTAVTVSAWNPIVVKNVTSLGSQLTPDVTYVSRDGGSSVLINGNIVWLYDDTECMDMEGHQLSFVSNTAAYADQPNKNVSTVTDFGVMQVGVDKYGRKNKAILADTTVGTGGWVPFEADELDFNKQKKGVERVAIWPGTSPTPISTTQAFLYAPLVYVDSKPQDPSKEYQARGMTLITMTAPNSGPVAKRQGDLVIPGTQVAFGGFSTLLGSTSTDAASDPGSGDRDVYLVGMTGSGLQLARVGINDLTMADKYTYFDPANLKFTNIAPSPNVVDEGQVYLPGSFSSGSIFYSPFFLTFIMIYFNKMVDSTFYIRYLMLEKPLGSDPTWTDGGKNGKGIQPEDAEALAKYAWSPEQTLYTSPAGKGGFNYAGVAHPEYFNRQYFAPSLYPDSTPEDQRRNDWYGASLIAEADASGDGSNLLLSWTSQLIGGTDTGIYQLQLAVVEFGDIPAKAANPSSIPGPSTSTTSMHTGNPPKPVNTAQNMMPKSDGPALRSFLGYGRLSNSETRTNAWQLLKLFASFGVGTLGLFIVIANNQ